MNPYILEYIKALKGKNDDLKGLSFKVKKTVLIWGGKPLDSIKHKTYMGTHYLAVSSHRKMLVVVYDGMVYMDRRASYDKLGNCPVQLPYPVNQGQLKELLNYTRWVHDNNRSYDISNYYHTDEWVTEYSFKGGLA